ncbi:MAG: NAD(P)-dependent oxidoreductase [Flavobacteriales bacterium]
MHFHKFAGKQMQMIKIGVIREGKNPPDERVPFSPSQCKFINDNYPNLKVVVQKSNVRRIKDIDYQNQGVELVDDVSDCDILMGIKEVPVNELIANKTYFYFSHTIKKQAYNRKLLIEMLNKNITMVDYETLVDKKNHRLIGFGRYAGIVGCYNTFSAYGKRMGAFNLKKAHDCKDKAEMLTELTKVVLPDDYKIVITGGGRVATGILEILEVLNIQKVNSNDFLTKTFNTPVFTQLFPEDYNKRIDNKPFTVAEFFTDASGFESNFMPYAEVADMYMSGHFWAKGSPYIFSKEDAKSPDVKIKVVGDISCDIEGPIACTLRASTIADPIYGYNPITESEVNYNDVNGITVMAVDNLPCELPIDASKDFGREFIDKILPHLIDDKEQVIERATICKNGNLMPRFEYLRDYVNGEVKV